MARFNPAARMTAGAENKIIIKTKTHLYKYIPFMV